MLGRVARAGARGRRRAAAAPTQRSVHPHRLRADRLGHVADGRGAALRGDRLPSGGRDAAPCQPRVRQRPHLRGFQFGLHGSGGWSSRGCRDPTSDRVPSPLSATQPPPPRRWMPQHAARWQRGRAVQTDRPLLLLSARLRGTFRWPVPMHSLRAYPVEHEKWLAAPKRRSPRPMFGQRDPCPTARCFGCRSGIWSFSNGVLL